MAKSNGIKTRSQVAQMSNEGLIPPNSVTFLTPKDAAGDRVLPVSDVPASCTTTLTYTNTSTTTISSAMSPIFSVIAEQDQRQPMNFDFDQGARSRVTRDAGGYNVSGSPVPAPRYKYASPMSGTKVKEQYFRSVLARHADNHDDDLQDDLYGRRHEQPNDRSLRLNRHATYDYSRGAAAEPYQYSSQMNDRESTLSLNRRSFKLNLPQYNGKGKWMTFIRQFEAITTGWSIGDRLSHLMASLTGEAAEFAFDLEETVLSDYYLLIDELERRYHVRETKSVYTRQFYSRFLRKGETAVEFAADLKRLIRKAFPVGLGRAVMEEMLLKQFFDGLQDEDLRYYVGYLKKPNNLDEAVDYLHEYDIHRGIERYSRRPVRQIQSTIQERPENIRRNQPNSKKDENVGRMYKPKGHSEVKEQQLMEALNNLTKMIKDFMSPAARGQSSSFPPNKRNGACFKCGQIGHFQKDCPTQPGINSVRQDLADLSDSDHLDQGN